MNYQECSSKGNNNTNIQLPSYIAFDTINANPKFPFSRIMISLNPYNLTITKLIHKINLKDNELNVYKNYNEKERQEFFQKNLPTSAGNAMDYIFESNTVYIEYLNLTNGDTKNIEIYVSSFDHGTYCAAIGGLTFYLLILLSIITFLILTAIIIIFSIGIYILYMRYQNTKNIEYNNL
jgi:hypothetical protein